MKRKYTTIHAFTEITLHYQIIVN